ncbi:metal ABC transporter permease [Staphylococcus aureus]
MNISDLATIIVIAIIVVLFITLFYKELFILSFDEEYSKVIGIHKWIQFLFIVIVADGYFCLNACCRDTVSKCFNHVTNCNKYANNKKF